MAALILLGGDERVCTGRVRASSVQLRLSPAWTEFPLKPGGGAPYKREFCPSRKTGLSNLITVTQVSSVMVSDLHGNLHYTGAAAFLHCKKQKGNFQPIGLPQLQLHY